MKTKRGTRVISILLTVLLVISMVPMSMFTTSAAETTSTEVSSSLNDVTYEYEGTDPEGYTMEKMSNGYIAVYYDKSSKQYTLYTTGGNQDNSTDNNKQLLFRYTQATHFCVDGTAQRIQNNSEITATTYFDEAKKAHIMETNMLGLDIEESLRIINNNVTGNEDLVEIKYTVTNPDTVPHDVASSIMIDTMLGDNDYAPFRIPGTGEVTTEKIYYGDEIPPYYQAFDNLLNPTVVSEGTFDILSSNKVDYARFLYWRKSYNNYYPSLDIDSTIGDSAVISGWNEKTLYPGETRTYKMYYGMSRYIGEITGDLYIGARCAEIATINDNGIGYKDELVTAYVQNVCDRTLENVVVKINCADGMNVVDGDPITVNVGTLQPGEEAMASWWVNFDAVTEDTTLTFDITADADNAEQESAPLTIEIKLPEVEPLPEVCHNHNYSENGFCINPLANGTLCDAYEPCEFLSSNRCTELGISTSYGGYYAIKNAGNLYWFADKVNNENASYKKANAVVIKNISVNADNISDCGGVNQNGWREWLVIGSKDSNHYEGDFDGRNHFISGLYLNDNREYAGLFGSVHYSEIKNLTLVNSYIEGTKYVGGICGFILYGGTNPHLDNVHNKATIVSNDDAQSYVGGIAGSSAYTIHINNSTNSGSVTGSENDCVGGIVGLNDSGSIPTDCTNSGTVKGGSSSNVGGISGYSKTNITSCTNEGSVSGGSSSNVGGICGQLYKSIYYSITKSSNSGTVTGGDYSYIGGIAGYNGGNLTISYNKGKVMGGSYQTYAGGIAGNNEGTIDNTYNIGDIQSGGTWIAGVCAYNSGKVSNSHNFGRLNNGLSYNFEHVVNNIASGTVSNCYYVNSSNSRELDSYSGTTVKTYEQFANGEVTALLHGTTANADRIWYQHRDGYPAFVYADVVDCATHGHNYENGFCINILPTGNVCDDYQDAEDTNGDGYYEITNGGNLYWFATQVNEEGNTSINGELVNNVYVNENVVSGNSLNTNQTYREWLVIGHDDSNAFAGTFDGQGYTISGLYTSTNTNFESVGLFGKATGDIKNVGVKDCYFTCGDNTYYIGGICAYAYHNSIINCYNEGCVITASTPQWSKIGGISALPIGVTIKNCYNTGYVTTSGVEGQAGGLFGQPQVCTIENCYNTGTVTATGTATTAGGFSGSNYSPKPRVTTVKNCYNTGTVIGSDAEDSRTGGMFGYASNVTMENCYNSGDVTSSAKGHVGGIYGRYYIYNTESSTTNCYNTGKITGGNSSYQSSYAGGIFGSLHGYEKTHTVTGCYNNGEIIGDNGSKIGGICGLADTHPNDEKPAKIVITNCYNTANVTGRVGSYAGGICGSVSRYCTVTDSYNKGNITTDRGTASMSGGVCGTSSGTISLCYNEGEIYSGDQAGYANGIAYNSGVINNCYNTGKIVSVCNRAGGIAYENFGTIFNCHNYGSVSNKLYPIGDGAIINCYYLVSDDATEELDTETGTTMKTAEQFASGEVTYLLNNKKSDGDLAWFQTLGTHDYPVFEGETIYYGYTGPEDTGYDNEPLPDTRPDSDVKIFGDINVTLTRIPDSDKFYRGSISLGEGEYNFRVNENGNIFGGNYDIPDITPGSLPFLYTAEATLFATGGNYTFTYNIDTNMLIITYVSNADVVSLVDPNTGADIIKLEKTSGTIYTGLLRQPTAKTIDFKVNDNGTLRGGRYTFYDTAFQDGVISDIDYSDAWTIPTTLSMSGGVYAFTYDTATKYLSIFYRPLTSDKIAIFGDINLNLERENGSANIYTATKTLNADTYVFRIDELGTTMCNGMVIDNSTTGLTYDSAWSKPTIFNATGGTYTFRYNADTNKLSVTYSPSMSRDVSVDFGGSKAVLTKQDDANIYTGTVELSAGTHTFNIDMYGVLYRFGSTFTNRIENIEFKSTYLTNTTFKVTQEFAGTFNIKFNADTKKFWIVPVL